MESKKLIYADDARRAILEANPKLAYCIERIKAVDAVEIVRCKDCEHCIWDEEYNEWECVRSADFNDETGQWYGVIEFVEEVHFCSYGERKDYGK